MLRFFPGGTSTGEVIKFSAFNGVLSAAYYNPLAFHSHLLIALSATGTIKNLSFSFCAEHDSHITESMFSLNINQASREVDISFNSGAIYYTSSAEITEASLENINQKILQLYMHPKCQTDSKIRANPKELLREFATCVTINENVIKTARGTVESVRENIPIFIELLASKIDEELKRLDVGMEAPTVILPRNN